MAGKNNTQVLRIPRECFDFVIRPYLNEQFEELRAQNFNDYLCKLMPGILDLA